MKNRTFIPGLLPAVCMIAAFLTVSCKVSVPIMEMSKAKSTITRAVEVKAEKYAPEELKKAQSDLLKSHDDIVSEDMKKAAEDAVSSKKAADDAIAKSLPLLAKDTLDEAKKIYAEAEQLYAEKFAPEEFSSASAAIKESDELMAKTAYWESYNRSREAIAHATAAREKSLAALPELRREMDRIRQDAENLKANRGEEFASGELAQVAAALAQADSLLGQNTVKEAFAKVSEADSALKTAMERTYKALALEKLEAAKTALANMQKAEIPAEFSADLETASSLVKYSGEDFENKSYLPSMTKSSDALALLNTMTIAMEKKREEARISGEKGVLPGEGRDLAGTPSDAAIPGEYVVRYNPKKRDCLWRIAHTVYRDARLWPLIYIANRDQIKDPDLIFPGQKFKIPPIPRKETVKEEKKEGAKSPEEAGEKQPVDKAE